MKNKYPCIHLKQAKYKIVIFAIPAKKLFELVKYNRREEDKKKGYQRSLTPNRSASISKFIDAGNAIPTNIVVAFDHAKISSDGKFIEIEDCADAGWVIDGQHRLNGASEAADDIDVAVTAFIGLSQEDQIAQFITINREAKKVPASLYLDLLPDLKNFKKNEAELAKERAVDIANESKIDETSPFYNKIVSLQSPAKGQISLVNFVRKVAPLVHRGTGVLRARTELEQRSVLENYFRALSDVFPKYYEDADSVFFKNCGLWWSSQYLCSCS
ncbi:MAG: DGQHR domain-containing protein [Blastochloris sp.]|nr:DGQHR domain-containing protein [Blastochloris sp.]